MSACSVCGHDQFNCEICTDPCEHLRVPNLQEAIALAEKYKDHWLRDGLMMPILYPAIHNDPESLKRLNEILNGGD